MVAVIYACTWRSVGAQNENNNLLAVSGPNVWIDLPSTLRALPGTLTQSPNTLKIMLFRPPEWRDIKLLTYLYLLAGGLIFPYIQNVHIHTEP